MRFDSDNNKNEMRFGELEKGDKANERGRAAPDVGEVVSFMQHWLSLYSLLPPLSPRRA